MMDYSIRLAYDIATTPDQVWRALTEPALLERWLMASDFRPELGHHFTFRAKPTRFWDGIVKCEVKGIWPMERLIYSWVGAADMPETIVTWELAPAGAGVLLTFSHCGFRGLKYVAIGWFLKRGWQDMISRRLPAALAVGAARPLHYPSSANRRAALGT